VLAYSDGLDSAIIIPWLKENYDCEVIAVAGYAGQGEELSPLREKAIATGASAKAVSSGAYRIKVDHKAYAGSTCESFTEYSSEVSC